MKNKAPSSATKSDVTAMLIMESVPKGPEERPHEELNDQYQKTKQSFYFTTLST